MRGVWGEVERVVLGGTLVGLSEGDLLRRFERDRDQEAFAALVARLGPMVLGVCRRELRDRRDVEDAFQATFLILARRAGSLRDQDRVGAWVYGVSRKVSRKARAVAARRSSREKSGDVEAELALGLASAATEEDPLRDRIRDEVARLPEKFREPLQLCHLEGFSHAEAAEVLRASPDAIRGRLERARALLRERLKRLGLGPQESSDDRALASKSKAVVPASLLGSTVRLALQSTRNAAVAAGLAREVLVTMMLLHALKSLSVATLFAATIVGTGLLAGPVSGADEPSNGKTTSEARPKAKAKPKDLTPDPAAAQATKPPEVVTSPLQARIKMLLPEGTAVKKGQVVVELEDVDIRERLENHQKQLVVEQQSKDAQDRVTRAESALRILDEELEEEAATVREEERLAIGIIESTERRLNRIQAARAEFEKSRNTNPNAIQIDIVLAQAESEAETAIARAKTNRLGLKSRIRSLQRSQRAERSEANASLLKARQDVSHAMAVRKEAEMQVAELQKALDACRVVAPEAGVVVYATDDGDPSMGGPAAGPGMGMMGGEPAGMGMPGMGMMGGEPAGMGMPGMGMMGGSGARSLGTMLPLLKARGQMRVVHGQRLFWIWDRAALPLKLAVNFSQLEIDPDRIPVGTKADVWLAEGNANPVSAAVLEKYTPSPEVAKKARSPRLAHFRILNPSPGLLPGKRVQIRPQSGPANEVSPLLMGRLTVEGSDVGPK